MIDAKQIADLFNQLYALDPLAAANLVGHRVICNKKFAESDVPFVCSQQSDGIVSMGVVGFVNAIASPNSGRVAAVYGDDKKLTGFTVVGGK
ncbi:hypothetical protein [Candidatus Symbiopectobacterium sp. NZEC135]|uniref:hypothetical protein n=1 Tax=Candidatus Symbiopectobacterium sp. NZEC135 TaxID=2820471 RepID=UPI0022275966|nr:hypothetical protein [Candidatus Symbiopectobacterium sp. NZEC135]MCW2477749.1 hypothetical protein [Candidatus Symbiopectobacterium sp. NZEC135]